jgi:hypothetical protein
MIFRQNIGHFFYVIARYMERVDFRSVSAPCVSFSEGECPPYIYLREEECRLLSWGSLLLLLFVLDLCYALGEEGVATIIDGRNGEGVSTIYERRRMPTVVVGVASPSFPCARYL